VGPVGRAAAVLCATAVVSVADAYPEGAPWGAARPGANESCATCHFDYEAIADSAAITVTGIPPQARPGATYSLAVEFRDRDATTAGFQVLATSDRGDGGSFGTGSKDMETGAGAIRSTRPSIAGNGISWEFEWAAPDQPGAEITFYVAVMASNDDGSPFGDQVHFLSMSVRL
jgi:hypothetical protein